MKILHTLSIIASLSFAISSCQSDETVSPISSPTNSIIENKASALRLSYVQTGLLDGSTQQIASAQNFSPADNAIASVSFENANANALLANDNHVYVFENQNPQQLIKGMGEAALLKSLKTAEWTQDFVYETQSDVIEKEMPNLVFQVREKGTSVREKTTINNQTIWRFDYQPTYIEKYQYFADANSHEQLITGTNTVDMFKAFGLPANANYQLSLGSDFGSALSINGHNLSITANVLTQSKFGVLYIKTNDLSQTQYRLRIYINKLPQLIRNEYFDSSGSPKNATKFYKNYTQKTIEKINKGIIENKRGLLNIAANRIPPPWSINE
jgi:hypothetical protein